MLILSMSLLLMLMFIMLVTSRKEMGANLCGDVRKSDVFPLSTAIIRGGGGWYDGCSAVVLTVVSWAGTMSHFERKPLRSNDSGEITNQVNSHGKWTGARSTTTEVW